MKTLQVIASLSLLVSLGLTACSSAEATPPPAPTAPLVAIVTGPATSATEAVQTATPTVEAQGVQAGPQAVAEANQTATPLPTATPSPEPTATSSPSPTSPPPPTATPSPTPKPQPAIQVNDTQATRINIRSGPGTNYPVVGQFEPGQTAAVTGSNEDRSWWQISLPQTSGGNTAGWVFGQLVTFTGLAEEVPIAQAPPPPPSPTPAPQAAESAAQPESGGKKEDTQPSTPEELADELRCGKDFCVTYQAMVPIWENGGCIGNHSIYITVLQGPPPGRPMDGIVIGDTFNNIEVASGSKGPGTAEVTLWMNTMSLYAKRNIDGTPYTSEESFAFTSHDELIPAEVLAANGYCDGSVDKCRQAQQQNQVCRGHYSWRVTFHKFD